ncbi:DUF2141 domain-containing protein [Altererythrobacter sp. ZODW24]|uniref:DUF2141 domain-containing protein n=1 Tax=Altererythrobacter sp. ZODW24 TaxID=2185142 RepID=UPI001F07440C|nr:DUF2141 domain-containing protein [Altererythrobacter sp. ZODW24]
MRHGSRHIRSLTCLAAAAALTGAAPPAAPDPGTTDVTVTISNLRNVKGVIRACMTQNKKRFPKCRGDASAYAAVVPAKANAVLTFKNVKPGTYAIALLHDENDNGKADRALSMIPKEGFGFSRDAKVVMSPPKFSSAAFTVAEAPITQAIRMRYMF